MSEAVDAPAVVGLTNVTVTAGVDENLDAFCEIRATGNDGAVILAGQLDAPSTIQTALGWIESACIATQDALVFRVLRETIGLDDDGCAQFLARMRELRSS